MRSAPNPGRPSPARALCPARRYEFFTTMFASVFAKILVETLYHMVGDKIVVVLWQAILEGV